MSAAQCLARACRPRAGPAMRLAAATLGFSAIASAPVEAAPAVTAEQAIEAQRAGLHSALMLTCSKSPTSDEIVVCGRYDGRPLHIPFPAEPIAGERVRGEAPSAVAQMNIGSERCSAVGPNPLCPHINLLVVALVAAQTILELAKPD